MTRTATTVPESEPLSHAVVVAVAELNDVDPLDLNERLYDCIDPDALDTLFRAGGSSGAVQFTMAGCRVDVSADRTVTAHRLREEATSTGAHV